VTEHPTAAKRCDVIVIGGGRIGTAIAWRVASAGLSVTLVSGERSAAASGVAAGMLAPLTETSFTEEALLRLNLASLQRYEPFVAEVEDVSGLPAGLTRTPTLSVAYDVDDMARLLALKGFLDRLGMPCERLTARDTRRQEPLLSPRVHGGLLVAGDWSCDNRLLWAALVEASRRAGVHEVGGFVHAVTSQSGQVRGVTLADGTELSAGQVVLANGAWAGQVAGVPRLPVRPVKGQIMRLDPRRLPGPVSTVRALVRGTEVYLVPRQSGRELVVGATVEEKGFDGQVTAGGVYELLRDARTVMPMTSEYTITETSVGWRPGTPDNAPILGGCELAGLAIATGHYRNGVLLTPLTAEVISTLVTTGELMALARPFMLDRFAEQPVS
jgi:glycine oxidase